MKSAEAQEMETATKAKPSRAGWRKRKAEREAAAKNGNGAPIAVLAGGVYLQPIPDPPNRVLPPDEVLQAIEALATGKPHAVGKTGGYERLEGLSKCLNIFRSLSLIPWLTITREGDGGRFGKATLTIDHELKAICDARRLRAEETALPN